MTKVLPSQPTMTAYASPPQFNVGETNSSVKPSSLGAPAASATLVALAPPTAKTALDITKAALEKSFNLTPFKPSFNIMNFVRSPVAWGNMLKGLAKGFVLTGVAAVSGSGAEIELAKLQGQIPGYVDARSGQLGSAALDVMTKNAGDLFAKLTPDQRGRLLMGAAPLMQALIDKKITLPQFQRGMNLLLGQVKTGTKSVYEPTPIPLDIHNPAHETVRIPAPNIYPAQAIMPTKDEIRNGWVCETTYSGQSSIRDRHQSLGYNEMTYENVVVSGEATTIGFYEKKPIPVMAKISFIRPITRNQYSGGIDGAESIWRLGQSTIVNNYTLGRSYTAYPHPEAVDHSIVVLGSGLCQLPSGAIVHSNPIRAKK